MNYQQACQILGVSPGTDFRDIKKKYRKLMSALHPDVHISARSRYHYNVQEINIAYALLKEASLKDSGAACLSGGHQPGGTKKASGAAVDSVWDAPVNENAYRERNIYYYEEDREGQVIGDFCIARGKYFWQTEEEFPLFLRSILQCSKELLDEADTALGRLKSPSKRTLIQAADPKASDGSKHKISRRSRTGYQSLHLWLRLKEDASPLPPENLNLQISRLLEQYKNAPS